jgi:hypothetical protein
MKTLLALALVLAFSASAPARADTMCSVLNSNQAFAVSIALDLLMDGGQQIQLLNDNTGAVKTITQAIMTPVPGFQNGYTVSVLNADGSWEALDIGHITAINQTSGKSVKLAQSAGCNP